MYKEDVLSLFRSNLPKGMAVLTIAMSMVNARYMQLLVTIELSSLNVKEISTDILKSLKIHTFIFLQGIFCRLQ